MSKMSQLHADLCERNGGDDPNDFDCDWNAPTGKTVFCDVCDKAATDDNPVSMSICCGIETYAHADCHAEF